MKILQLAKFPPSSRGGIEKLVNQISSLLSAPDVRIDILCLMRIQSLVLMFSIHTQFTRQGHYYFYVYTFFNP